MTSNLETTKLARKAAQYLGGAGELARYLNVGRPWVMRFLRGASTPNEITVAALRAVIENYETTRAFSAREGDTTNAHTED
jgi:hypothetical protein